MRKSKNRYFYHILVSPGDAPGAESHRKDTDQGPQVATAPPPLQAPQRPRSVQKGSAETTTAEGCQNLVAGLWGHTLGRNWPPEPTSSHAPIDPWC